MERSLELGLRRHPELHPDVVELEEVLPDADGNGGLTIRDLVRRTRRHNPARAMVGEVMGPEVVEMLSAMSQGNNGSAVHHPCPVRWPSVRQLATYAAQYEKLDFAVAHSLIATPSTSWCSSRRTAVGVAPVRQRGEGGGRRPRMGGPPAG